MTIPYAGDKQRRWGPSAHTLFRMGKDTAEQRGARGEKEHVVLRALTAQRSKARALPVETAPSPYSEGRIAGWRARA